MIFTVKHICLVQRKALKDWFSLQDLQDKFNTVNIKIKKVLERSFIILRYDKNKFSG